MGSSGMAWYPLPQTGGTMFAGDEFFDNQTAGWSLWSFTASDDQNKPGARSDNDDGPWEEQSVDAATSLEEPTEDIFKTQFSDEEVRRMDGAPFEALDMFPGSMHRLLSYENMLAGSSEEEGVVEELGGHDGGVDAMDTCGFPLFSHDLQLQSNPSSFDKAGPSTVKRSRAVTGAESTPGFQALALEELEDVVFQLTKRTRTSYRDAFYRLAQGSKANCSTSRQSSQQPDGNASRFSTPVGCHEKETNAIDRTVLVLTMNPPPQLYGTCFSDDWVPEAQSTPSWTARE